MTKRLRDIPSVPTADLADVESEESAMTEGIVENLLKRMAKKQKKKLQDEIAPLKTPKKEIPTPGTSKKPACIKETSLTHTWHLIYEEKTSSLKLSISNG